MNKMDNAEPGGNGQTPAKLDVSPVPKNDASPVFDVAAGGDVAAFNSLVAAFYGTCGSVFNQTFNFSNGHATVNFLVAPTVQLGATDEVLEHARALAEEHAAATDVEKAINKLTAGSLTATCSSVHCQFSIEGLEEGVTGSVTCSATVEVQSGGQPGEYLYSLILANPQITIPNEPSYSKMLTNIVGPLLVKYLNEEVLGQFKIPAISLVGVNFTQPVINDESAGGDDYLVAYTGMEPVVTPPAGTVWPSGTLFAGVDEKALDAVAQNAVPVLHGEGGCDDHINLSWEYHLNFSPTFSLQPGAGSTLNVPLAVSGGAGITWHTPNGLPNVHFGASFSGSVDVSAALNAVQSGANEEIEVVLEGVSNIDVHIDFGDVPWPIDEMLEEISSLILDPILNLVGPFLHGISIHVYTLEPITLNFVDLPTYQLVVQNLQLSQIEGPSGTPLALVTASAGFQPVPSMSAVKASYSWSPRPSDLVLS